MYIVATISKNSYAPEKIREILAAGAEVLRFNLSHGSPEEGRAKMKVAQDIIQGMGLEGKVKILADLPGNKLRLGRFDPSELPVKAGEEVVFKSGESSPDPRQFVPVDFPKIGQYVEAGQIISIGDGELGCEVVKVLDLERFVAKILNDRYIPAMKALNIGRAIDELDHFTEATLAHINKLADTRPEWVAFSFVRSAADIEKGRALLAPHLRDGWNPKIVAKVESLQAIDNIDAISAAADVVLVARGDLGLTAPIEMLGIYQKKIVKAALAAGKEAVVSTQILDSLLQYYVPQRAEILDLTNIVLDGAHGIMLAKETGISLTPGRSVEVARKIIDAVESHLKDT